MFRFKGLVNRNWDLAMRVAMRIGPHAESQPPRRDSSEAATTL